MLSEFPTIHLTYQNISDSITNRLLKEELSYDIEILRNEFQSMHSRLNDEHIFIFDEIVNASTNKKKVVYILSTTVVVRRRHFYEKQ